MNKTLATSLTTGFFLIISISGLMLFLHLFNMQVKTLHEYLGLAFVVAVLFHLFYNWKSMKKYFSKKTFYMSLFLSVVVSLVFVVQSSSKGTNPRNMIIQSILNAPIEKSYSILNIKNAQEKLLKYNIKRNEEKTILDLAKANKTSPFKLISILTEK